VTGVDDSHSRLHRIRPVFLTRTRASSLPRTATPPRRATLIGTYFELDALTLDHDPPRLDLADAERRDDISHSDQLSVDERLWRSAHHRAFKLQVEGLRFQVLHEHFVLSFLIGSQGHRLCNVIPESVPARNLNNSRFAAVLGEKVVIDDKEVPGEGCDGLACPFLQRDDGVAAPAGARMLVRAYSGGFEFKNLAPGVEMTLRAEAPGYTPKEVTVVPTSGSQKAFLIEPSPTP